MSHDSRGEWVIHGDDSDIGRHAKFQFGKNPMEMTSFEKSLEIKEKLERKVAHDKYVRGIQGRDGGCFESESYDPIY